ncbi:IS4 family transposase [Synergistales bacterium]|nr:IS4 family transposase [Synergistales bacterium]
MNLKVGKSNGRTYLSIAHGYRDNETGKVRTKTIKSLGYLDVLEKEFPDPIAHFRKAVEEMNKKEALDNPPATINLDGKELIGEARTNRKNLGYAALSKIFHELELSTFFSNRSRELKTEYNVNNIMKLLVFSRILSPMSKKKTLENKGIYFENFYFTLDDIYRCLTFINTKRDALKLHLHRKIKEQYGRETELVYYDVTNYYFEIDEPDTLRKKGVSKEHRPDPIVQMGLFMDTMGIPISYDLFPGNTHDCSTLIPLLAKIKREYDIGRVIVVADKGMNTGMNVAFNLIKGDGYVYSQTVRGGHKELKDYVLDNSDYRQISDDYKIKSRLYPREIIVRDVNDKNKKVRIDEKQVVFYSKDYDKKAKAEREPALIKARELVNNPSKYNRATSYGAAKYVKNLQYDKKTGEIVITDQRPVFDEEKLREEEKFDGYYAIVTSEYKKTDEEIIEIYRGLWKIEESFKVTKSDLETRPVYLSREDHIQAHFLICFLSLVIIRILERRLGNVYSASRIIESLSNASCSVLEENWYVLDYADEITKAIYEKLGIDLRHKYLRLGNIRKIIGSTKKPDSPT